MAVNVWKMVMALPRWIVACVLGALLGASSADALEPTVVVSIKPVHSLVAGVMAGVGQPVLLVKGGSPHDYSLRPSEARALDNADLVFWIGPNLEAFMAKALGALAADARIVALSESQGVRLLAAREGGAWDRDETHAGHDDAGGLGLQPEAAAGGGANLHLWLDPRNAEAMVDAIVAALITLDPANAAVYQENAEALRLRLRDLDEAIRHDLAPVRARPFVVFHDAYPYFEDRYELNAVGAITVDPERRPGARRLQEIRAKLAGLGAACVFAEPQFEPTLVDTVIEGTGASKGVLDPLGADLDAGPEQYFQLMTNLADSLVDCLAEAAR